MGKIVAIRVKLVAMLFALSAAVAAGEDYLSFKTEDEANNIEIFRKASPSVVYITNKALRRDFFSYNVHEIPRFCRKFTVNRKTQIG